jgi:hypothetical protein
MKIVSRSRLQRRQFQCLASKTALVQSSRAFRQIITLLRQDTAIILPKRHRSVGEQLETESVAATSPDQVLALWHADQKCIAGIPQG